MKRTTLLIWYDKLKREYVWWLVLCLLGSTGIFLMRYMTPNGMGLVNDSVEYIGGARNILLGNGYSRIGGDGNPIPITHFPPMFSMVLVAISFFGLEVIRAARFVNLLLFGANIILTGIIIRRLTSSKFFSILGALIFLIAEPILRVHSFILSEPLYLFLVYCLFIVLIKYLEEMKWYWVVLAGIISSMAFLDRYIGGSLYVLVGVFIVSFSPTWKRKVKDVFLYLVTGIPAPAAWMIRNTIITGNPTNRPLSYHPIDNQGWYDGVRNFWGWLLPDFHLLFESAIDILGWGLILLVGFLTVYGIVRVIKKWRKERDDHISPDTGMKHRAGGIFLEPDTNVSMIAAFYAAVYFILLMIAITFFDEATTLEHRMLLPLYVSVLILGVGLLSKLWQHPAWIVKLVIGITCLGLLFSFSEDSLDTIRELHSGGQGFASGRWRNSATLVAVRQLPQDVKIFTNKRTAVYLLADRGSYVIPWRFYPEEPVPDPSYVEGVNEYRRQVLNYEAVVVIFDYEQAIRDKSEPVMDMTQGLPIMGMYDDGAIFGLIE